MALQIQRTADEVFEAIVDPAQMSNYFISKSSGRIEEGKELTWHFPEFEGGFPVRIGTVEPGKVIAYSWDVADREHLCTITLKPQADGSTVVAITEKPITGTADIAWLKGNTEGWANFLACLKAWLEYGVHLRRGAFEFRRGEM